MAKDKIDFSGVPEDIRRRGASFEVPDGDYCFTIKSHEKKWKDDDRSNAPYYRWTLTINKGEFKGKSDGFITSLKKDALFNLRNLIYAAKNKNVAGKSLNFDPASLYGLKVMGTVEHETFRGNDGKERTRARVQDVFPMSEAADSDADEEEVEEEEEEEDELEEVDVDDL